MSAVSDLRRDYRAALLRFLSTQSESARTSGYEIGRHAVERGVSVLDIARMHHDVLAEVLAQTPAAEQASQTARASEFMQEVLATFDMAQSAADLRTDRTPQVGDPRPD